MNISSICKSIEQQYEQGVKNAVYEGKIGKIAVDFARSSPTCPVSKICRVTVTAKNSKTIEKIQKALRKLEGFEFSVLTPDSTEAFQFERLGKETQAIHAGRQIADGSDVTPPIHISTTYVKDGKGFSYARSQTPTRAKCEAVLGALEGGHAVIYGSKEAAFSAAIAGFRPSKTITIEQLDEIQVGDLLILQDVNKDAIERAKKVGAKVLVSTLHLTTLEETGADMLLHSGGFIGGHNDLSFGVLVAKDPSIGAKLSSERLYTGEILGTLETSLLLRSLTDLPLRMKAQVATTNALVSHFSGLQTNRQSPTTFSFKLPPNINLESLRLIKPNLEVGGIQSTYKVDDGVITISVGLENHEDLIADLEGGELQMHDETLAVHEVGPRAKLGALEGGEVVLYPSGTAALNAVLNYFNADRIVTSTGYMGSLQSIHQQRKLFEGKNFGMQIVKLEDAELKAGDLIILESPTNPTCIMQDIEALAKRAKEAGATLVVDSTFATPLGQKPLELGADIVLHSCTKFIGGHSDVLAGALITKDSELAKKLNEQMKSKLGKLETELLERSLSMLPHRYARQSASAVTLANWLNERPEIRKVWHPSLPTHPSHALNLKVPPACFSFELVDPEKTDKFIDELRLIIHATSLGGVETTIEPRKDSLIRISVGVEALEDLMDDLNRALIRVK